MNKGYAKSLDEICGNPIWWVDKYHLWQEVNRVVDYVRDIAINSLAMNFVKIEDIHKLWKRKWTKITKEDIAILNEKQPEKKKKAMRKYRNKAEQRLKIGYYKPTQKIHFKLKWIF